MDIPDFLQPLTNVLLPKNLAASAPGGAAAQSDVLDNFTVEHQQQDNWCWAAVSTSISRFFNSQSTWTECSLANAELQRSDCCGAGGPVGCNIPWYLDTALTSTGNLASYQRGTTTFAEVQNQIAAKHPLGCRIGWQGDGGHFVALGGWVLAPDGTQYIDVYDPIYGFSQVTLATFSSAYQGNGSWTDTYFTQP